MLGPQFMDNGPSPLRTYRIAHSPFQQVPTNNLSHLQEAYQNLPQLSRAGVLPFAYSSYEYDSSQSRIPEEYLQHFVSPVSAYQKLEGSKWKRQHLTKNHYPNPNHVFDEGMLHKREGHGWTGHHKGNSPALSALALLGFMFFLNLIQTSLQNNRQMLAAAALNATTLGLVAGRGGNIRHKRDINFSEIEKDTLGNNTSVEFVNGQQNKETDALQLLLKRLSPRNPETDLSLLRENFTTYPYKAIDKLVEKQEESKEVIALKKKSSQCLQLLMCKFGKSIYRNMDATAVFMVRRLGKSLISAIPKKTWTGRLMRAFHKGWKTGESCGTGFQKCILPMFQIVKILSSFQPVNDNTFA